ncbi:MAG TPA: AbrB/MazE/SpoVT family DNA-binding domain-containing protein [Thermoanaerobaculia bacterium]
MHTPNIPAAIRKRYQIREGDRLVWIDEGEVIRVIPVPADPIAALRGSAKGERLLDWLESRRGRRRSQEGQSLRPHRSLFS